MALLGWLAAGAAGVYIRSIAKKNAEIQRENEINAYLSELEIEKERKESERRRFVNQLRRQMPCMFNDALTSSRFESLAVDAAKQIARIRSITVEGAIVYATVESQTGLSAWEFNVDFNNWGHIDGTCWTRSENDDSSIPERYGKMLSGYICAHLRDRNIIVPDFSDIVDANRDLGTDSGLCTHYREKAIRKIFRRGSRRINMEYDASSFCGEHIFPVISLLKQAGFVNIVSIPIEDVDSEMHHYVYEVEKVTIAGESDFRCGYAFPHNALLLIYYHSKRRITMPHSGRKYKHKHYSSVVFDLQELGFSEIYVREINDLLIGFITKDGAVENVLIAEAEESPIKRGQSYYYDTKIVVCYHTYK